MEYIEKSSGVWNYPYISSKTLNYELLGYVPKFRGGCMGIIPHNGVFVVFSEDDDYYFEIGKISISELTSLNEIFKVLTNDIKVKTDYVKSTSKTQYYPNKKSVFRKNYSIKNINVNLTDRGKLISPLVKITINNFK